MIKKGVFQITVDFNSFQIKIAITNFVFIKLLQNVISKCQKFKILQNILFANIFSDPFTFTFLSFGTKGWKLKLFSSITIINNHIKILYSDN